MNIYQEYLNLLKEYKLYNSKKIPLSAAETYVSDFVKEGLVSDFEGKYCIGNRAYSPNNNFIGSEYIHRLFDLLSLECNKLFKAKYTDARTLSGMNCMAVTINSLLNRGDKVLLTTSKQGGHSSVPILLGLSGIGYEEIPYDYLNREINYSELNKKLQLDHFDAIIFAQSDLINTIDVSKIDDNNILIIFDATQTFGMIATGIHQNPLLIKNNIVLIGGTHKTIPGPTCGLILTNNTNYADRLEPSISPDILRNVQPNNIASLLLALIELEQFGEQYEKKIIENANYLAKKLEEYDLNIAKINEQIYTNTHQIFILCKNKEQMNLIYGNASKYGITLNTKTKPLFNGYGIRLGVQEITRYGWEKDELDILAYIIYEITKENPQNIIDKINYLAKNKANRYVFDDLFTK